MASGFHIPKGYIYAAMAFSVLVEAVNIIAKQRRVARRAARPRESPVSTGSSPPKHPAHPAAARAEAQVDAGRPRPGRPKSAPRKKKPGGPPRPA